MEREVAVREWATQKAIEIAIAFRGTGDVELVVRDAQKLVDFVTEKQSKPNMP